MKDINSKSGSKNILPHGLNFNYLDGSDKALVERAVRKGYSRREVLKLMVATW